MAVLLRRSRRLQRLNPENNGLGAILGEPPAVDIVPDHLPCGPAPIGQRDGVLAGPMEVLDLKFGDWRLASSLEKFTWSQLVPTGVSLPPILAQPKGTRIGNELAMIQTINWHLALFHGSGQWHYNYTLHENCDLSIKEMLIKHGPLVADIDTDERYNKYSSYSLTVVPPSSGPQKSHSVVVLGWLGCNYLIVENKGSKWGDRGYGIVNPSTRSIGRKIILTLRDLELKKPSRCLLA